MTGREVSIIKASFQLGAVVTAPGAKRLMEEFGLDPTHYLARHVTGDSRDLSEDDKKENDFSVSRNLRILWAYGAGGRKLWIITEEDHSATTILCPDEY